MSTTEKKSMTREEQIELQRKVTAEHIQGENDGEYEGVRQTFVQDARSYFDCVPGGVHFDGTSGIQGWYDILGALLPAVFRQHDKRLAYADDPTKLLAERAYWDNEGIIKQMKGEEAPPLIGLAENPRVYEHNSVKRVYERR